MAIIFDTGKARFDSTTVPAMAFSVVSSLHNQTQTANEYLLIRSFVVTQNDILAALRAASETEYTVPHRGSGKTRLEGWKLLQSGNPMEGIPKGIQGSLFNDRNDLAVAGERLANNLLSLPEADLAAYIKSLSGTE
jgi:hypothetical protein